MRRRQQYARRKSRRASDYPDHREKRRAPRRFHNADNVVPGHDESRFPQGDLEQAPTPGGRSKRAALPRLTGRLSVQRSGVGFIRPDSGRGGDIFVHHSNFGPAWHGDHVEVTLLPRRGRSREGVITAVLERGRETITAEILRPYGRGKYLCRPLDPRMNFSLLARTQEGALRPLLDLPSPGDIVLLKPGEPLESGLWAAEILENFGPGDALAAQEGIVKASHGIPTFFPDDVLAEAEVLHEVGDAELADLDELLASGERKDLRHIPFVTIDGESARDFDDAVYVEERPGSFTLWVGIADVSHYVRPASALDGEALARGNSYYFPQSVEPMLPEALSNDLCSLRPNTPRLAMAARMPFDGEGRPSGGAEFCAAVIQSRARLTYTQVFNEVIDPEGAARPLRDLPAPGAKPLDPDGESAGVGKNVIGDNVSTPQPVGFRRGEGPGEGNPKGHSPLGFPSPGRFPSPELITMLKSAEKLARLMHGLRREAGGLDFELPEPEVRIAADGETLSIAREERNFAHQLIEMFMVATNEAVAAFLTRRGAALPYRVHPPPDPEKLEGFFEVLARTGLVRVADFTGGGGRAGRGAFSFNLGIKTLASILEAAQGTDAEFVVSRLMLRSMMQARYALDNEGHFGLASACYCHFTSPIRRYADLLTHRALKAALRLPGFGPLPEREILEDMLDTTNSNERVSKEAEREILKRMTVFLLKDRVGEVFDGVISGITEFGVFVELTEIMAEGMVPLEALGGDYYDYFPERQELLGRGGRQRYYLGMSMRVRLVEASLRRLEINLEPVEGPRGGRGRRGSGRG